MCVVDIEVQVNRTDRCVGTQCQHVTAHVRVRQDVFVAHIRISETNTRLAGVHRYNSRIRGCQTELEEVRRVVRDNLEGVLLTVIVTQHQSLVSLRSPRLVRVTYGIDVVHTFGTHSVHLLYVVPLAELVIQSDCSVVLHAPLGIAGIGFLRGDQDHTVAGTATIQGCCCRAFQY